MVEVKNHQTILHYVHLPASTAAPTPTTKNTSVPTNNSNDTKDFTSAFNQSASTNGSTATYRPPKVRNFLIYGSINILIVYWLFTWQNTDSKIENWIK